jgi:hypothetical protein
MDAGERKEEDKFFKKRGKKNKKFEGETGSKGSGKQTFRSSSAVALLFASRTKQSARKLVNSVE